MAFATRLSIAALALLPVACTTHTETFPGATRDQVWTALVRAAESPRYPNWHVIENDVWQYQEDGRIEVWRLLRRYNDKQNQMPRLEDSEWSFAITLEDTEPPSASFVVRSACIPSHGWEQRERYFDQVWEYLGGRPLAPELADAPPAPTRPAEPALTQQPPVALPE